jgi:hypothetical protein
VLRPNMGRLPRSSERAMPEARPRRQEPEDDLHPRRGWPLGPEGRARHDISVGSKTPLPTASTIRQRQHVMLPVYHGLKPEKNYIAGRARRRNSQGSGIRGSYVYRERPHRSPLSRRECGSRHSIQGAGIILVHNHPTQHEKSRSITLNHIETLWFLVCKLPPREGILGSV